MEARTLTERLFALSELPFFFLLRFLLLLPPAGLAEVARGAVAPYASMAPRIDPRDDARELLRERTAMVTLPDLPDKIEMM